MLKLDFEQEVCEIVQPISLHKDFNESVKYLKNQKGKDYNNKLDEW